MSDKQYLGPGSTKDRLDATLEWNAAIERQSGRKSDEEDRSPRVQGAAASRQAPDLENDSAGDRGC